MTAKQAAAAARAKKDNNQQLSCMAATYRQFVWACAGGVPPGNYYDGGEEFRDEWKERPRPQP
jgi:hypothetical protein